MRRTQLYLEDDLWNLLHVAAAASGTSVSQLVRDVIRERYSSKRDERRQAMRNFVGIRRGAEETVSAEQLVRGLRRGSRLDGLNKE